MPPPASPLARLIGQTHRAVYTNWRGQTSERLFTVINAHVGTTAHHPGAPQLLLRVVDHGRRGAERLYAARDIQAWLPAVERPRRLRPPSGRPTAARALLGAA